MINDRWGKGDRHKHGGYYTTEYGAGLPNAENPWEENRGMGHSYGYNRRENLERRFESVELAATVDCGYCMPYENNRPIFLCRGPKAPLSELWPRAKHYD